MINVIKMTPQYALILALLVACTGSCGQHNNVEKALSAFRIKYQNGEAVSIAVIGDSTTSGFGANGGPNLWTNGLSYGCVNQSGQGTNWDAKSPYYINVTGTPSQAQQDNTEIPSAVRLLRSRIEFKNEESKIYNYGGSGWTSEMHIENDTMRIVSELKPDIVFINLGINSAKNNTDQNVSLRMLVMRALVKGIPVVLVKPNNVGVAFSPQGQFVASSCPDDWHLMDNWQSVRDNIQLIADDNGLEVIDMGEDDKLGDVELLYDSFHPSALGYKRIFRIYADFLDGK